MDRCPYPGNEKQVHLPILVFAMRESSKFHKEADVGGPILCPNDFILHTVVGGRKRLEMDGPSMDS